MSVYRVHKTDNFTTINNYLIKDKNLTLKDKGMMLLLLSLPNDWNFSVMGLQTICREAKNTINDILNHLEELEYLERNKVYVNGKIKEWRYDIYEIPKTLYRNFQDIENVDIEKLDIENCTQLNTNKLNKKELNTKKVNNTNNTIFDLLQENGFVITPLQHDVIAEWEDNELTRYAIKKAVLNNKFNINYINKILFTYEKENIKTVEQAIEKDEEFNRKRDFYYKNKFTIKESRYEREKRLLEEMSDDEEDWNAKTFKQN